MPLLFGRSVRRIGRLPALENENLFAEPTPTSQDKGLVLIGRPGLSAFADVATGPVRAMFQQPGIFDGDRFVLAGTTLYRIPQNGVVETVLGTVAGNERAQIAGGLGPDAESEIRIVTGDEVYLYDGLTVVSEAMPTDVLGFTSIEFILGCWVAVRTDSQELYFRFIDSAVWDALDFESAEFKPDKAVCVKRLGDQLVVLGEASVQLFAYTGDATFPLQPYGAGLVNEIGCRARDSVARVRDTLFFVGDDCQVYALSPGLEAISDPGLTEILRGAAANTLVAWGYLLDGHEYYVLATEVGSFIHDRMTKFWSKASTYGQTYWRPWFGVQVADRVLCADGVGEGTLWYLDPEAQDDDGEPIVRRFTAWLEIAEGRLEIGNLVLNCVTGWAPQYTSVISSANLWTYSSDFENPAWSKTDNLVVTNDALTVGGRTFAKIDDGSATDEFFFRTDAIANDAVTRTVSLYLYPGSAAETRIDVKATGGTEVLSLSVITWATHTVAGTLPGTLEAVGDGVYRFVTSVTNNSTGNTSFVVGFRPANLPSANTGYCYVADAQYELGATATEYTPITYATLQPKIKARAYRDGQVPGPWREASLGQLGDYGREVRWNRWGQFKSPGALFEFEVSDPVVIRANSVRANVP